MRRAVAGILLVALLLPGCIGAPGGGERLRVGSTTSTHDSGLLDALLPRFEADTGIRAAAVVAGTGEVLEKARRGDVDVLLTHSPEREEAFVESGAGLYRKPVMHNRFLLVGPPQDPARVAEAPNASVALARIADAGSPFVSRGDRSGTHDKEVALWRATGRDAATLPRSWYKETGASQATTLLVASEKGAYALTDEATWAQLNATGKVPRLAVLVGDDAALLNPYGVIPVKGPKQALATAFADWLTGPRGQAAIAAYTVAGQRVFTPDAGGDA